MKRPPLNQIPLCLDPILLLGEVVMTMGVGRWDCWAKALYEQGGILLDVDLHGEPVAMYQNPEAYAARRLYALPTGPRH